MSEPERGTTAGSPRDGSPPYGAQLATELEPLLGGLLPELASRLRDVLRVSNQRAARLQRLQGAVSSLTRSLDETRHSCERPIDQRCHYGRYPVLERVGHRGDASACPIARPPE